MSVSNVAGAINVSRINRFSIAFVLVGVELFLFLRDGDGVPAPVAIEDKNRETKDH